MTIINQMIVLFLLNLCLFFLSQHYTSLLQQQREYHHTQLAYLQLLQGKAILFANTPPQVYQAWQEQLARLLPAGLGKIDDTTITINYQSIMQDDTINLSQSY